MTVVCRRANFEPIFIGIFSLCCITRQKCRIIGDNEKITIPFSKRDIREWLWIRNRTRWSLDYSYGRRSRGSFRIPNTKLNRTRSPRDYSYGKRSHGKFRIPHSEYVLAMNHAELLSTAITSDDPDTPRAPVHIMLFVAVLFIYDRTFYYLKLQALGLLVFFTIYLAILRILLIENCPLCTWNPNFGQT